MKHLLSILLLATFCAFGQIPTQWMPITGTNTYSVSYTTGGYTSLTNRIVFGKFANSNTGASTLALVYQGSVIGTAPIRAYDGDSWEVLAGAEIDVNTIYKLSYNGSYWQLESFGTGGGGGGAGTVTSVALATGTSGTDVNISGSPITTSGTITLNLPSASADNRGLLTSADWTTFNGKQSALTFTNGLTNSSGTVSLGGTLTGLTSINTGSYSLNIAGYDGVSSSAAIYLEAGGSSPLNLAVEDGTNAIEFILSSTGGVLYDRNGATFSGIEYSDGTIPIEPSTYNDGTLPPKKYVDEHLAGLTFTNSPSTNYFPQYNGTDITWVAGGGSYTDEDAQDAVGAMVDASLTYVDGTPLLQRSALTGAITATAGSNATSLGSFTVSQLSTAVSDADIARTDAGQTFTGVQSMTSPDITTSITTPSTTFSIANTTATTGNIFGAATTLNVGGTPTGAITHNYSANATASAQTKTLNIGTGGATGSTSNINIGSGNGGTTTLGSVTTAVNGLLTAGNPNISSGITTPSISFNLINTTATTVNAFGAAENINFGGTPTTAITHNYSTNATAAATTKTINFGTGGAASSTTNINIGDADGGTTTIASPTTSISGSLSVSGTPLVQFSSAGNFQIPNGASDALDITDGVDNILRFNTTDNRIEAAYPFHNTTFSGTFDAANGSIASADLANSAVASLSGTNTGDQTTIVGITGTKAQFSTAVTDGDILYVGDVTSNATHTGEVTGSTALTVDKTAITNKTLVTAAPSDHVLIADASDSDNLKKVLVSDLTGGASSTDLAFTGASSPVTLTSSTGTDVTFTAGSNITLTGTGSDITIAASGGGGGERTITFVVNEGPTISTGGKNYTRVIAPFSGTIVRWKLIADASSTVTVDVWKDAGAIPTNSNTITASAKPSLSSAAFNSSSTLTGWTTSVTEGDILILETESVSGCNYLSLTLVVQL